MIVHIPLALAILIPLVSAGVLVALWKGWLSDRTWWIVIALQAALLVGGFVALQTGERDEERVERFVPEAVLESHESAAKIFEAFAGGVLVLMLLPIFVRRASARRTTALLAAVGTLGVAAAGINVGQMGGKLIYEHGAASAYAKPGTAAARPAPVAAEHDDDDDDD